MKEEKRFLSQEALEILALLPEGLSEEAQEKCYRVFCRTKSEMASDEMLEALQRVLPKIDHPCYEPVLSIVRNAIKKAIE